MIPAARIRLRSVPFGDFPVVGNGERGGVALLDQDNMAAAPPGDLPAEFLERSDNLTSAH
jgi:hypothetical protein